MPGTRLYVDEPIKAGTEIRLQDDRARYISRVLRLQNGDPVTLFDGSGHEFPSIILSTARNTVVVAVNDLIERNLESPLNIHLLQGVSRGERMDHVVQKATELGVSRFTPVLTAYSVVKLSGSRAEKRLRHWQGIAASACEQCGRNRLPAIESPVPLRDWLGAHLDSGQERLILTPGASGSIRDVAPDASAVAILIGPEGGFSAEEIDLAEAAGFAAVGFGPRVLRTESAAVAALAALQTLFGDLAG